MKPFLSLCRFAVHRFILGGMLFLLVAGCGSPETDRPAQTDPGDSSELSPSKQPFTVGAIPDQNISDLNRRFEAFSSYLSEQTGLDVRYTRSNDYAALVTAFKRGEVHLGWFGGLTGVQARMAVEGAEAIAQRKRDRNFHSKFIVQSGLDVHSLSDLRGKTFSFGSESSTSGHLMPRYYLLEAGLDPEEDFAAPPNFSGSHDKTWKLVESGAYQAGALNEAVWQRAVEQNQVDTAAVRVFYTTPPYYDYNWTLHGEVDERFGDGTREEVKRALLEMDEKQHELLDLFAADKFVPTKNENYRPIRETAEKIGIIR